MATSDEVRRIALSLEGTVEVPHMDRRAFRVARIYATLPPDGRTVNLLLTPDEQGIVCDARPEAFAKVPGGWGRMGFTTATLDALGVAELEDALVTAWEHARPRAKGRAGQKR